MGSPILGKNTTASKQGALFTQTAFGQHIDKITYQVPIQGPPPPQATRPSMTGGQREWVRQRAGARCEYCRLPDFAMDSEEFHVEHIIPRKHRGEDGIDNLAWACIFCNLHKGPNLASFDPDIGELSRLFNPRRER